VPLLAGHPRRELTLDAEALGRAALAADELVALARGGLPKSEEHPDGVPPDPAAELRIMGEAVVLRNYQRLFTAARGSLASGVVGDGADAADAS
jgi:hypothetical protein